MTMALKIGISVNRIGMKDMMKGSAYFWVTKADSTSNGMIIVAFTMLPHTYVNTKEIQWTRRMMTRMWPNQTLMRTKMNPTRERMKTRKMTMRMAVSLGLDLFVGAQEMIMDSCDMMKMNGRKKDSTLKSICIIYVTEIDIHLKYVKFARSEFTLFF